MSRQPRRDEDEFAIWIIEDGASGAAAKGMVEVADTQSTMEAADTRAKAEAAGTPTTVESPGARVDADEDAARRLLGRLLPALDALENCVRARPDFASLKEGVRISLRGLWDVFRPFDLERIEGWGMPFDPRVHEAAAVTPSVWPPANTVLETLRVGYVLGGKLVRPALVRVSVEPGSDGMKQDEGGSER